MSESTVPTPTEPVADDLEFPQDHIERRSAVYRWLINIERFITSILLVGLFVLVITQVVTRYVFNSPLSWTEESARLFLVWLTFLAAAFVSSRRAHITVDLITTVVPKRVGQVIAVIADIIVAATAVVIAIGGIMLIDIVHTVTLPATGLPTGLLYAAALVGFVGVLFHTLIALYLQLRYPDDEPDPADKAAGMEGI